MSTSRTWYSAYHVSYKKRWRSLEITSVQGSDRFKYIYIYDYYEVEIFYIPLILTVYVILFYSMNDSIYS